MKSIGGIILAALGISGYILALGYFAWRSEKVVDLVNSISVEQKNSSRDFKISLSRLEEELRKKTGFPSVEQWLSSIEKPMERKLDGMLRGAYRKAIREELERWSNGLRNREKERQQNLLEVLRNDREAFQKRVQLREGRWEGLLRALQKDRKFAKEKYQEESERWKGLLDTMGKDRQAAKKQYIETVNLLNVEKSQALERVRQLEEERKREVANLLEKAKLSDDETKKKLSEFCAKRPESVICRDL
ncbi:MAG: hypothetical protein QF619_08415 [Candidatus Binatia bacterium]|nr:hypothetical protein [Candidatus Binatia bacterium]